MYFWSVFSFCHWWVIWVFCFVFVFDSSFYVGRLGLEGKPVINFDQFVSHFRETTVIICCDWPYMFLFGSSMENSCLTAFVFGSLESRHVSDMVFSCNQSALTLISVCPSVCPSVCLSVCLSVRPSVTPLNWQCSCHRIILKFSGVTINRHDVRAKGQGQRSKVKLTEVMTPFSRFRTVTPIWIHIWRWNDAQSVMLLRRGTLLFFKIIRQISRSHG